MKQICNNDTIMRRNIQDHFSQYYHRAFFNQMIKTNECTMLTTFIMAYFPLPYTCFGTLKFHLQGFVVCYQLFTY